MIKGLPILAAIAVFWTAAPSLTAEEGAEGAKVRPAKRDNEDPFAKEGAKEAGKPAKPDKGDPFAKEGGKEVKRDKKDPFGKGGGAVFGEDLDGLAAQLELTDEQKEKLQKIKDSRDKAMERFEKANGKKVTIAEGKLQQLGNVDKRDRRAGDMRRQLEGFLQGVKASRDKLSDGYGRRMFALLTPEQKAKWNGPILTEELTKEFSLLFLEGKQQERLQKLCDAQAKRLSIPLNPEKHAKALDGLKLTVYRSILNRKQQAEYRQLKAPKGKERATRGKKGR